MALKPEPRARPGGVGPAAPTEESALTVPGDRDAIVPIVVPNTLWQSADPTAYSDGRATDDAHLREYAASDAGRHDDARWGALEIIPTKADFVLDLIRANSLWPLLSGLACCAIEMMS
ncbi:MAG: hypothetical protein ACXWWR_08450, partial [Candidatus Limnocylindrales bacterium]